MSELIKMFCLQIFGMKKKEIETDKPNDIFIQIMAIDYDHFFFFHIFPIEQNAVCMLIQCICITNTIHNGATLHQKFVCFFFLSFFRLFGNQFNLKLDYFQYICSKSSFKFVSVYWLKSVVV